MNVDPFPQRALFLGEKSVPVYYRSLAPCTGPCRPSFVCLQGSPEVCFCVVSPATKKGPEPAAPALFESHTREDVRAQV